MAQRVFRFVQVQKTTASSQCELYEAYFQMLSVLDKADHAQLTCLLSACEAQSRRQIEGTAGVRSPIVVTFVDRIRFIVAHLLERLYIYSAFLPTLHFPSPSPYTNTTCDT